MLLGETVNPEELEYVSLEKQVTEKTPPCFIWQTATDELVPVENSYLMAQALKERGVPYAHHVFSQGKHGLSLADQDWAEENYGEPYTMEQVAKLVEQVRNGAIPCTDEERRCSLPLLTTTMRTRKIPDLNVNRTEKYRSGLNWRTVG